MNWLDALENVGQREVSSWCAKGFLELVWQCYINY